MRGTPRWSEERSPDPEEEAVAETMCCELTIAPIPCPLCCWQGGGRELGIKLSPLRRDGVKMFLRFDFTFVILLPFDW